MESNCLPLAEPPKPEPCVPKSQLVPQLVAGLVLWPLPCGVWPGDQPPSQGKSGWQYVGGLFLWIGERKTHKRSAIFLKTEKKQEGTADKLYFVFCTLYSMYLLCVPATVTKALNTPQTIWSWEFLLLQITVHGKSLTLANKRGQQVTGFFPELWDDDFVRWLWAIIRAHWGPGGVWDLLEFILLT